ncbi:MAG: hypothetical protein GF311_12555 [Candidatus Lokiarchaeota archaeon]|nr:hypothetical protein [Candidatus Lokiarchaeota archaeon]
MRDAEFEHEVLYRFLEYFLNNECELGDVTSTKIASQFSTLDGFLNFDFEKFKEMRSADGYKLIRGFRDEYIQRIRDKLHIINSELSVNENFIQSIGREFIRQNLQNIQELRLAHLNPNPFLINILNLREIDEMIEFLVFQRVSRSIVTSFGTCVENLLIASGTRKLKKGFDILKIIDEVSHYIQVKSGTSDMDKDQIKYWQKKIEEVEAEGHQGYIGMTYGKDDENAISISLMKSYLPNWEARTLIGKELWEFVSGEVDFHLKVLERIKKAAEEILSLNSIVDEIENTTQHITNEFKEKYGKNIEHYLKSLF